MSNVLELNVTNETKNCAKNDHGHQEVGAKVMMVLC